MKRPAAAVLFLACVALAWWMFRGPHQQPRLGASPETATSTADDGVGDAAEPVAGGRRAPRHASAMDPNATPPPSHLARSLRGTEIDGGLVVDASGHFVPTLDALSMFDYFFSALGEASEADIVARIRAEIDARTDPPADAEAHAFLDRYLAYREQGRALIAPDPSAIDLRQSFERLRALRRQIFGAELADRLFGDSEAVAEVALRQQDIEADPTLTPEQKEEAMERSWDALPEEEREARKQMLQAVQLRDDEAKIRAGGGTAEDIRRLRVERFGEEAADRLDALDREDAQWDSRLADYRKAKDGILADRALTQAQKDAALQTALEQRFDPNERIRVAAIEEARAQP